MKQLHKTLLSAVLGASMLSSNAYAEMDAATAKQIDIMQQQIKMLQTQLNEVKKSAANAKVAANSAAKQAKTATADAADAKAAASLAPAAGTTKVADAKASSTPNSESGVVLTNKNNIKLTLGGFIEAAGIYRSKSESTDMASNFTTGIPFPNTPANHLSEFRSSARQSRLSLLAQGKVDPDTDLSAYFEGDFLGAAVTANSNETNSYTPRIRQIFASIDRSDINTHVLAGQTWSLLTMDKAGIVARQENIPQTIDAQYVPGFTFTRNPQLRITKEWFDKKVTTGFSLESPQALVYNSGINPYSGNPIFTLPGTGTLNTTAYTTDFAPDMIAKIAIDPGYGHYEVYGIARFFRDRNHSNNSTIMGGGAGAAALLPIIKSKLEFQISGLAGTGIGRYGASQLPDVTLKSDGGLATIDSAQLLAGFTGHPTEQIDLYTYAGIEGARKKALDTGGLGYGYGSSLYNNAGCSIENAAAATCVANTSRSEQLTAGGWWKFYKGSFGTMQAGLQDSYTRREIFRGTGGAPNTNDNITMVSLRYYPF